MSVLDCGHKPTPSAYTGGFCTRQDARICYQCADSMQRADMAVAHREGRPFTCYLAKEPGMGRITATTWTGGELGRVISRSTVRLAWWSHLHGKSMYAVTVRDFGGRLWYGRGSPGIAITLRPKVSAE